MTKVSEGHLAAFGRTVPLHKDKKKGGVLAKRLIRLRE